MRDRLGSTFTLLAILLILGVAAINLLTINLYGRVTRELNFEKELRQKSQAQAIALKAVRQGKSASEVVLEAVSTELAGSGLQALAIYEASGRMQLKWQLKSEPDAYLNRFLPSRLPEERAQGVKLFNYRFEDDSYALVAVPVDSGSTVLVVFSQPMVKSSWGFVTPFLLVFTILILALGGFFLIRSLLRKPVVESPRVDTTEFVFDSLQSLIDRLQVKSEQLERLRSAEKQRAEFIEMFNERIVASIPNALVVVDLRGRVLITNAKAVEMFAGRELKPLEVNYQDLFSLSPRLLQIVAECLNRAVSAELQELDAALVNGHRASLAVSVSPITWREGEARNGALVLISDMTEVKELRDRVAMQQNLASLGEMAAGLAHEFKNSLAAISGYGQFIESVSDDSTVKTSSKALVQEVADLTRMVTDFLNFARPQRLHLSALNLRELVEDCVEALRVKATEKGVALMIEGEFPAIDGDQTLLRRALLNLIDNGIDATSAPAGRVVLRGRLDGDRALIEVADNGVGIPKEDLASVFIPFFTTKSRGYGIGLALVQKIVLAHHGSVRVESREGEGTTFCCVLPLHAV